MDAVFALGSNSSGQLGIGHTDDASALELVRFADETRSSTKPSSPIVQVAAGGNHTLLLTSCGEVYWSGQSSTGACGSVPHEPSACWHVFRKASLFQGDEAAHGTAVRQVAATWEASLILTADERGCHSRVYSLGSGTKGELGRGPHIVRLPSAQPIPDFPPPGTQVTELIAGIGHAVVILTNGDAYGWGNGRKGQLGAPAALVYTPRKIPGVGFRVVKAVCGKDFTCLFGEPATGEVLFIGLDRWGMAVAGLLPPICGWKAVHSSWGNVYVLTSEGALLGWGRNDHGQLPPDGLPKLLQIAAGSEHVVALTDSSDVIAWGWGEHGNCGQSGSQGVLPKRQWNVLALNRDAVPGTQISVVGAGCATSWIIMRKHH